MPNTQGCLEKMPCLGTTDMEGNVTTVDINSNFLRGIAVTKALSDTLPDEHFPPESAPDATTTELNEKTKKGLCPVESSTGPAMPSDQAQVESTGSGSK